MTDDDVAQPRSRLFTVRVRSADLGAQVEHRGTVRDVETGAFRSFRDWSDLTAFLTDQLDDVHPPVRTNTTIPPGSPGPTARSQP